MNDKFNIPHQTFHYLISSALNAEKFSYSPYSNFAVGCALLCDDEEIILGCNIENSSFSNTICAERVAFSKAISNNIINTDGTSKRKFKAICITGCKKDQPQSRDYCTPCGICLQFISEFCDDNFIFILAKSLDDYEIYSLAQLLPKRFKL